MRPIFVEQEASSAMPPGLTRSCPLCRSTDLRRHLKAAAPSTQRRAASFRCTNHEYGRHPEILRCRDCGFVFLKERPTAEELSELYGDVEDPLYEREEAGRQVTFDAHLGRLEQIVGSPQGRRLLDVGAYTGVAVEVAVKRGWEAVGVDPCRWAVESGRRRGRNVILGSVTDASIEAMGLFDVVTLWDVIEHLADPEKVLSAVFRSLRPGGIVAVHTMDVDSLFARLTGRHWPWYMEMHLFYFSPATLSRLFRNVGFEVVHVEHRGRTVSAGYLASRVTALAPLIGKPLEGIVAWLGLSDRLIRVGFGDLFTIVGQRLPERPVDVSK